MYRTNFGIGHNMREILDAHTPPAGGLGDGHKGLFDTVNKSLHFQVGLALASVGTICSMVAQHMYSLPPYAFLAQDFTTHKRHCIHITNILQDLFFVVPLHTEQSSLFVIMIQNKTKETC